MDLRVLFIGVGAVMRADYLIPMLQDEDERVKNLP
jgi:hypothetical protein